MHNILKSVEWYKKIMLGSIISNIAIAALGGDAVKMLLEFIGKK